MKGVVFTEFIEWVEDRHSPEIADAIIVATDPPSGGAYTAVGTYDHAELVAMVVDLAKRQSVAPAVVLEAFGEHLFGRFFALYPNFFDDVPDAFAFLSSIEDHIHAEVRKLYPDADLPRFDYVEHDALRMVLDYRSVRCFGDLAEGLIKGCIAHFGEPMRFSRETFEGGQLVRFALTREG